MNSVFRFDDFCLIPARRELWRAGRLLSVQPKVLDSLVYLVQHRDRAVGKDELVAAVWGRADVSDEVLGQIVGRARRAVGDTGDAQHSIRTVPRFGFRWIRAVDVSRDADDRSVAPHQGNSANASPDGARSAVGGRSRRWRVPAAAAAAVLVGAAGWAAWAGWPLRPADDRAPATALPADAPPLDRLRAALAADQLDAARAVLRRVPDHDRMLPAFRHEEAVLALKEGRADGALAAFTSLLTDLDGEGGSPLSAGKAAHGAAQAAFRLGDGAAAQRHYEHAIALLRTAGTGPDVQAALGRAWSGLGGLHTADLDVDAAQAAYAQARSALERAHDPLALAGLESNVGLMLQFSYGHAEALARFERAAKLAKQAGDASVEASALVNLVNSHLALLQPADAMEWEPRLRELREQIGDPLRAAHVDLVRAQLLLANGRLAEADVALRGLAGRPTQADPAVAAHRELIASDLAFARGAWDEGSVRLQSALASDWYSPDKTPTAYARWRLLTAREALEDVKGVAEAAAAAEAQGRSQPDNPSIGLYAALARAEAAATAGDAAAARVAFDRALAQAEENRVPFDLVNVVAAYARFLVLQDRPDEAGAMVDRIAVYADHDYAASVVRLGVYHAIGSKAWAQALATTLRLAGERVVPAALTRPPGPPSRLEGLDLASVRVP